MSIFKRFAVVVGAVAVCASSSFAYWDYFQVIEGGSAEAKVSAGSDGMGFKVRFGIMDNLEIVAQAGAPLGMQSFYGLGARYQVLPEMLAIGLDFGIPTDAYENIGFAPSAQFHMGINDMISLGAGVGLGIDINSMTKDGFYIGDPDETEAYMNLEFGLELDFQLTEAFGLWVGCDFAQDLTAEEADMVIVPGLGLSYTADNLTVGTNIGIHLDRVNRDGEADSPGLSAGVEFGIKF